MSIKKLIKSSAALAVAMAVSVTAMADLLVIVHPDNDQKFDAKFVKNLFLGKEDEFNNRAAAAPIMLADDHPLTELFLSEIVKQKPVQFKRIWSKALFTGNGNPPEVADSEAELIRQVMSNPSLVGYIDASQFTNDVRAVLRLKTK